MQDGLASRMALPPSAAAGAALGPGPSNSDGLEAAATLGLVVVEAGLH